MKPDGWPDAWSGKTWKAVGDFGRAVTLTEDHLLNLYDSIGDESAMLVAVGADTRSDRRFDKAIGLLRKAGLVKYVKGTGWTRA